MILQYYCIYHSNDVNTVSIAITAERYSEMYDSSSGGLAIFKIVKKGLANSENHEAIFRVNQASFVDSENHGANVLIASCWRRAATAFEVLVGFIYDSSCGFLM